MYYVLYVNSAITASVAPIRKQNTAFFCRVEFAHVGTAKLRIHAKQFGW